MGSEMCIRDREMVDCIIYSSAGKKFSGKLSHIASGKYSYTVQAPPGSYFAHVHVNGKVYAAGKMLIF